MDNKFGIKGMSAQKKLIIQGFILSTILIIFIAGLAIFSIQNNLNTGYKNFGQILSKTLAIESVQITKNIPESQKVSALQNHSDSILRSNDDIAFIEFRDANSNIIYSSKDLYYERAQKAGISVSSPIIGDNSKITGSVMIGLSGTIIEKITTPTRAALIFVFLIAWLAVIAIIGLDTVLLTKELKQLHDGGQKISSGEFVYNIDCKDASSEIQELCDAFNKMSNKLNKYNEQTMESITLERNKLEAVLMSIANGVVVCDNFDTVVIVNDQAKKLLEVTDEEILDSKINQYCDTNGELCFKEKIEQFKDTPLDEMENKPLAFNIEVGQTIIKSVISPMFSRSGDYVGYIIVPTDANIDAHTQHVRSHFIPNVSHELRTPVTVLRSYIDTLYNYGNEFDFDTQKEFIGTLNTEIIRLNRMVNDILDFSRLESANVKLEKQPTNIIEIIETTVKSMKVLADERHLTFSVMKEPDLPEVMLNEDSIGRALKNLISNAIKYSHDGKRIKVRAEMARVGDFVEVSVEDQGPGIPEQYQQKNFERFFRIENDTHTIKGTGLGLHLVKIAIEKHHRGQVFVQSKVGEGSTFGFRLPINALEETENNADEKATEKIEACETEENEDIKSSQNDNFEQNLAEQQEILDEATVTENEQNQPTLNEENSTPLEPQKPDDKWEISFGVSEKKDN